MCFKVSTRPRLVMKRGYISESGANVLQCRKRRSNACQRLSISFSAQGNLYVYVLPS